jgi:hypothetical protein
MATIREYFDADFNYAARMHLKLLSGVGDGIEIVILYDFSASAAFIACYVEGDQHGADFFRNLIGALEYGKTQLQFDGRITLPSARAFPGKLRVENTPIAKLSAQFFGDVEWLSAEQITATRRIFIYSESSLLDNEVIQLKDFAKAAGHDLQFRSLSHAAQRSKQDTPLAFICHDSRDKEVVARKIALNLQRLMCPVWYDEFSLKVGDRLRDTIEHGLKTCNKCVIILSKNFFLNTGWTKTEFDSIFTREIFEKSNIILPVWYGVTQEAVFNYSPSLLNVKGLDWSSLGEEEVCRQLCQVILPS